MEPIESSQVETKGLAKSETVRWIVATLVAYIASFLVRKYGIPGLPPDVQSEVSDIVLAILNAAIPLMSVMAIRARARATALINGWWH